MTRPWIGRSLERAPCAGRVVEGLEGQPKVEVQVMLGRQEMLPFAEVFRVMHRGVDVLARIGRPAAPERRLREAKVGADVLARD